MDENKNWKSRKKPRKIKCKVVGITSRFNFFFKFIVFYLLKVRMYNFKNHDKTISLIIKYE